MQNENTPPKETRPANQETEAALDEATCSSSVVATVEWIRGERRLSSFMRNAGLGLSGLGIKERVNISYKPEEVVTEERVMKAVQSMIAQSNAENAEFEISCPRVIQIIETNRSVRIVPPQ